MIFLIYFQIWAILFPVLSVMDQSPIIGVDGIGALKHLISIPFIFFFLFSANYRDPIVKAIVLLLVAFSMHGLASAAILNNVDVSIIYVRFQVILLLIILYVIWQNELAFQACKYFFYSITLTIVIFGILHITSGFDMTVYTNRDRFSLGFVHPGKFGNLFLTLSLLANVLYFRKSSFYVLMVIFIAVILYTYTRNIFLSYFIGVIVPILWRHRLLILPTLGAIGVFMVYAVIGDAAYYQLVDSGSSGRLFMWALGFQMNFVSEASFILFGGGNELISPIETFTENKNTTFRFDNSYLEFFLRDGLLGVFIAGASLWLLFNHILPKQDWGKSQHILWSSKYMMLFFFMFDSGLFSLGNLAFIGFCFSALALHKKLEV